ncbi:MAG: hypothetical protein V3W41_03690 [Planctomycetota bacterium]
MAKDLIGRELDATETEILETYRRLKALGQQDDLAPCVSSNLQFASAAMWQIINDLGIDWEQPYDEGL